jgi:hypothetical protein
MTSWQLFHNWMAMVARVSQMDHSQCNWMASTCRGVWPHPTVRVVCRLRLRQISAIALQCLTSELDQQGRST